MTAEEDIASVAGQLADLTRTVEGMASEIKRGARTRWQPARAR